MKKERNIKDIEAIEKETREFSCPCCNARLQFRARINISSVGLALSPEEMAERDGREVQYGAKKTEQLKIMSENQAVLDAAKKCGIFESFNKTLEIAHPNIPVEREAYFLKWLSRAAKSNTPQYALWQCFDKEEFSPNDELELWGFQNVCAVLKNNEFKVFVPNALIKGEMIEKLKIGAKGVKVARQMDLTAWVRTKYGYVAQSKEFSSELRKHSIGSFQL